MDDLVVVGRVGRRHGLDGAFVVEQASDDPARFAIGARLVVDGEEVTVLAAKRARGRPVIRVDREVAPGRELAVPRRELPPPQEGAFYVFELIGLAVAEDGGRALGHVIAVEPGVANDVLELDSGIALPLHEACVLDVDLKAQRILVARGFAEAG